tara:strand:- start:62 stop:934 length:873 start_codon:yes stop_codon:yes gene_type:complete
MELNFLTELHEARMTRNTSDNSKLSYTDCCERLYLMTLVLELLRKFSEFNGTVAGYATKTTQNQNYKQFRMHGTDLYNLIYFVSGDDDAMMKLKDFESAKKVRASTFLPVMGMNRWLMTLKGTSKTSGSDMLMSIERACKINNTDYKTIRRAVTNWDRLSGADKKKWVTKLLLASRAKLRNSDIIMYIEELARKANLEDPRVKDNEPTVSMPDMVPTTAQDLALYRYIVGAKNVMGTKKFLDAAKKGQSMSPAFVKAYLPAVELLDDIVKAGPGYIQMLRALQKRAKNSR